MKFKIGDRVRMITIPENTGTVCAVLPAYKVGSPSWGNEITHIIKMEAGALLVNFDNSKVASRNYRPLRPDYFEKIEGQLDVE